MTKRWCPDLAYGLTLALLVTGSTVSQPGLAQGITVGAGGTLWLGSGQISLRCSDLTVAGQLNMNQGTLNDILNVQISGQADGGQGVINLSGNWSNTGVFEPGSATVNMNDGCGVTTATIAGNTTFHNLTISTASGRQIHFTAGSTQTVNGNLTLTGVADNLLKILSTATGSPAFLDLTTGGGQSIDYVDVQDNHATGQHLAPGEPAAFNSVDRSGNLRWFLSNVPTEIPTLSPFGMMAALLALMIAALRWRRRLKD